MALLGGLLNLNGTLTNVLGGGNTGGTNTGLLSPVTNLIANLTNLGGTDGEGVSTILNLGLLTEEGVVELNLLGSDLVVLPRNGGIVSSDLLGGDTSGLLGGLTHIIELDGLLSDAGLLNLTGVLGPDGILDLNGVLREVLELLSLTGTLNPTDPLDPDGEVDPNTFDNQLFGTEGRDTFLVPDGSTYIDGRGDIDIVNFAQSSEGMSFAVGADAVVFAKDDTLYYFQSVERVNFFEGTLYLDTGAGENSGMAYRLYQAAFDRTPDGAGLQYWIDEFDLGTGIGAIAAHFIHSREFIQTFGTEQTVSNRQFVELMYTHTLGRNSDQQGQAFWVDRLESEQFNRADVLAHFSESQENQQRVAEQIDNGIWIA